MNRIILHIDFNSYFATVEQQANPRLRGKPVGVTGGDRLERTVIGAASVEAKRFGVRTGMQIWEAKKLCPQIILVAGDSDKYLECSKRFWKILKDHTPYVEIFSIDECFLELPSSVVAGKNDDNSGFFSEVLKIAQEIKSRIKAEIGEVVTCSIGISYNKLMAKLAGSLQKPDGLVVIENEDQAIKVLDKVPLDEICGIGGRIKYRLNKLGIFNFKQLREVPLEILFFEFKSYGKFLYEASRGINKTPLVPFYEKDEVKSVGHRHTVNHDTKNLEEIKQILLKLCEMVAKRLRDKRLIGKTVHLWYRDGANSSHPRGDISDISKTFLPQSRDIASHHTFIEGGIQTTVLYTNDGLEIFKAGWRIFHQIWSKEKIRMVGVSVSNLKNELPATQSFLPEERRKQIIIQALDKVNDKFGDFTLQRGVLLTSARMKRKPNPYLSDRRFKL